MKKFSLPRGKGRRSQAGKRRAGWAGSGARTGTLGSETRGRDRIERRFLLKSRMIEKQRNAAKAKAGAEMLDQPLAHQGWPDQAMPFASQRGHRSLVAAAAADALEKLVSSGFGEED